MDCPRIHQLQKTLRFNCRWRIESQDRIFARNKVTYQTVLLTRSVYGNKLEASTFQAAHKTLDHQALCVCSYTYVNVECL
jgi:hypothetical protein